jgi:PIN domain nuclease of toxin-antitoxin system
MKKSRFAAITPFDFEHLPLLHSDPFDRLLIAQATVENLTLLTGDATVARTLGPSS